MTRPDYLMPLLNMDRAELVKSRAERIARPGLWTLERQDGRNPRVRFHRSEASA